MGLEFLDANQDLSIAFQVSYSWMLVIVSYLAACMAAYTAWGMSDQFSIHRSKPVGYLWLSGGAFAMGCGIWAMHFIGMLAYQLPIPVIYNITGTLMSVVPAILSSGVAIYVFSHKQLGLRRLGIGGVIFGVGIGTMHYSGMAAMRVDALMLYDKKIFIFSILIAVVLSYFALWLKFLTQRYAGTIAFRPVKVTSIAMMGMAVAAMHYIGMTSVYFFPREGKSADIVGLDPLALSTLVIVTTSLIMGLGIVTSIFQQRLSSAHQSIVASRERMKDAINSISDGFVLFDEQDRLVMSNDVFRNMYSAASEWIKPGASYRSLIEKQAETMMSENTDYLDYICRRLHWHDNPVEVFNETLEDGRHVFGKERRADTGDLVGIWTDISELKKAEDNIRKSSEQVKRMLEASPTPIVIRNLKDRTILYFNQNAARYYQSMRNPIVIGTTDTLFDLSQVKPLVSEFLEKGEIFNKEVQFTAPDGETVTLIYSATIVSYEHQPAAMYSFMDITERKKLEEELRQMAQTDSMTGIFNRRYFTEMGRKEFKRCRRNKYPLALLMLDIDHFKQINDTYGHSIGDEAIKVFCVLCQSSARDIDIIGRLGGEEFGIVIPDNDLETANLIAERIRHTVEKNIIHIDEMNISYTVSIGICELQDMHQDFDALMNCADVALYQAKQDGRNRVSLG